MRAILLVTSIENESAGPSYTVPALCEALATSNVDAELHTLDRLPKRKWGAKIETYKRSSIPLLKQFAFSGDLMASLKTLSKQADIMHVNGVWEFPDIMPPLACRKTKCKVVYCPRGGLSSRAMQRGRRLFKTFVWHLGGQWRALKESDMFHAASMKERDEIRALGLTQPIAVIPNGIDIPNVAHRPFSRTNRRIAFFGRIHETKAPNHLIEAWGRVANDFKDWSVEIAGPDCGAVPMLKELIARNKIPRVSFVGELNGAHKYEFLANADLYVLPSLTENFGITIAEALACGTPCIASKGCPWPGLVNNGCGWWVDVGSDAIEKALRSVLLLQPNVLANMGAKGRAWVMKDYSWNVVGEKMAKAYDWLINGGTRPPFIYEV